MKKIFILYLMAFGFLNSVNAQTVKDIVGVYSLRGATHFLKPDQTFVMVAYATVITGKWELKEKGLVHFIPDYEKEKFTLYGRHNKNATDSSKIMLSYGFYDDETLLHFGPLKKPVPELKRIFKPGHRHISFPYVYLVKGNSDEVSFTYFANDYDDKRSKKPEIYTFVNKEKYNDFIGFYWKVKDDNQPFYYQFKNGRLYSDEDTYSQKNDLAEVLEEIEEGFKTLVSESTSKDFSPKKIYSTPMYNFYNAGSEKLLSNFKFNEQKNAWLNILNYEQDEELSPDYDYNKINIVFEYTKVEDFTKTNSAIKIDEVPIFISPYAD